MGAYAIIHFITVFGAALTVATLSARYRWPAVAMLLSLAGARFAEWGPFEAHNVMMGVCLACMFVCLQSTTLIARAIATLYFLRICVFILVPPLSALENAWIVWELSNALILLQVLLLSMGATDDWMGKSIRNSVLDRIRAVRFVGRISDVLERR